MGSLNAYAAAEETINFNVEIDLLVNFVRFLGDIDLIHLSPSLVKWNEEVKYMYIYKLYIYIWIYMYISCVKIWSCNISLLYPSGSLYGM